MNMTVTSTKRDGEVVDMVCQETDLDFCCL